VLVAGTPPLVPRWTAELSLWLVLLQGCAVLGAVAMMAPRPDKNEI
jgi:hypothetical protein